MMDPQLALQAASRPAHSASRTTPSERDAILVIGAGGVLGAAVLAHVLASGIWHQVQVMTQEPLIAAPRGLQALQLPQGQAALAGLAKLQLPSSAIIVMDQPRQREAVFYGPRADELLALATALRQQGVQDLTLVLPHASALLPTALRQGLMNVDEAALAALGYTRLLLVRPAAGTATMTDGLSWPQRLANWMLGNLRWMVAARDQPVRAPQVAAFVVEALRQWQALAPDGVSSTRVAPADQVWLAAQPGALRQAVADWLSIKPLD